MLCPGVTRVLGDGTVLIPFRFVLWIGCCIVSLSPEIARYPLHMYLVGPDRLGAALDAVLPHVAGAARMHCTLLRLRVMRVGASLRSQAGGVPPALLVMDADLLVLSDYDEAPLRPPPPARVSIENFAADAQGRHDFERACAVALTAARAAPLVATPLPFSPPATEFLELGGMSGQDGTMLPLSLLELAWWPRFGHAGITLLLLGAAAAATRSPKSRALFLPSPRHWKVSEISDGVWRDGGFESSAHYVR